MEKQKLRNPSDAVGIEFHYTDGNDPKAPTRHELDEDTSQAWFMEHPNSEDGVNYKILSLRIDHSKAHADDAFTIPFNAETVEHAFWKPEVYYNFSGSAAGGASTLLDEPCRFLLQTPRDDGPFCSLALSRRGNTVKGLYVYDDDDFEPGAIAKTEMSISGWRSSGLQIISLPTAVLRAHSRWVSARLREVVQEVAGVEAALADVRVSDFGPLSLALHRCSTRLIDLERRSRFEAAIVAAVEATVGKLHYAGSLPWAQVASERSVIAGRAFDFESLPRRIADARATISSLIQQRNELMNLEIAEASRRMTEIAISDNASMKTIAIMTMVFLPGTAVASFFSMAMFDWSAGAGSQIASKWLWVYFVIAVPLTAMVVAFWWLWAKRTANRTYRERWRLENSALAGHREDDIELLSPSPTSGNGVGRLSTGPNK